MNNFIKLVFIKILFGVACVIFYQVVFDGIISGLIISVFFGIFGETVWVTTFLVFLEVSVLTIFTYKKRFKNTSLRNEYVLKRFTKEIKYYKISYNNEIKAIIKDINFIAEVIAFVAVFLPFLLIVYSSNGYISEAGIMPLVMKFIIMVGLFIVIDLSIWLFVRRKWIKEKLQRISKIK